MSTPRYPAEPFPPGQLAAATAARDERLARWAADPDRGWTFELMPTRQPFRRTWRTPRTPLVTVRASRYNETRFASARTPSEATAQLRRELGLTPAPTEHVAKAG